MQGTSSDCVRRRVPNVVSSQSAARKYDRRNASAPPRKPRRTFQELTPASSNGVGRSNSVINSTISISNDVLSQRIVNCVRNRQFWMSIEADLSLFANPYDDLSGVKITHSSSNSREFSLIERALKHDNFSLIVRGQSGSGKSSISERLFMTILESHASSAHRATGHAAITALRPLMRYATTTNPLASFAELSFQFAFEGERMSRGRISRGGISGVSECPLILAMITSQMCAKEKDLYRIRGITNRPQSVASELSLKEWRRALRRLSISTVEVEKVLCAILKIRTLQVDKGIIDSHHQNNAENIVSAASLLGVSPSMLKKVVESSRDQKTNDLIAPYLIFDALIDYVIDHANSLLDEGISRGKLSPTESDSSAADSGIEIAKSTTVTIEVDSQRLNSNLDATLRKSRNALHSLFSPSNCRSSFALRLFSASTPPLRTQSRSGHREQHENHSIICLRTNDDCEYMRPDSHVIKRQLQDYRKRIDDPAPALPLRDY